MPVPFKDPATTGIYTLSLHDALPILEASELYSSLFAPADPAIEHGRHGEHADISARYQFRCAAMSRLQQLEILVFDLFPDSQRLVLQAITPKGQTGAELTAKRNLVDL